MNVSPPLTRKELIERANAIAGITILQLANMMGKGVPESSIHTKVGLVIC